MLADDVATTDGMDPDFVCWAFADEAGASVAFVIGAQSSGFANGVDEGPCGTAGGVFFKAMVEFDDFRVVAGVEAAGGFGGEIEEEVNAGGVVPGPDDGYGFGCFADGGLLVGGVAGGADDKGLVMVASERSERWGCLRDAEVDEDVACGGSG